MFLIVPMRVSMTASRSIAYPYGTPEGGCPDMGNGRHARRR